MVHIGYHVREMAVGATTDVNANKAITETGETLTDAAVGVNDAALSPEEVGASLATILCRSGLPPSVIEKAVLGGIQEAKRIKVSSKVSDTRESVRKELSLPLNATDEAVSLILKAMEIALNSYAEKKQEIGKFISRDIDSVIRSGDTGLTLKASVDDQFIDYTFNPGIEGANSLNQSLRVAMAKSLLENEDFLNFASEVISAGYRMDIHLITNWEKIVGRSPLNTIYHDYYFRTHELSFSVRVPSGNESADVSLFGYYMDSVREYGIVQLDALNVPERNLWQRVKDYFQRREELKRLYGNPNNSIYEYPLNPFFLPTAPFEPPGNC